MAASTTLNQNEVAAIQKDWKNREFVEVVKLNMLQVGRPGARGVGGEAVAFAC